MIYLLTTGHENQDLLAPMSFDEGEEDIDLLMQFTDDVTLRRKTKGSFCTKIRSNFLGQMYCTSRRKYV